MTMKNLILILILTAITQSCFSQRNVQPFIGVNFSSSMLDEDRVTLNNISVEPGFQYNHRIFVSLSIGYVQNHDIMNTKQTKFRGLSSAASVSVRLLESQYKLSPVINLVLGNIVYSSARGETINREFMSVDGSQGELIGTFDHFRYFGKVKFMLDLWVQNFNFRLGPTYGIYEARLYSNKDGQAFNRKIHGMGAEIGLTYSLPPNSFNKKKL